MCICASAGERCPQIWVQHPRKCHAPRPEEGTGGPALMKYFGLFFEVLRTFQYYFYVYSKGFASEKKKVAWWHCGIAWSIGLIQ